MLNEGEKFRKLSSIFNFILICLICLPLIAAIVWIIILYFEGLKFRKFSKNINEWISLYKKFN
jgi:Na+/H+-dicarboxylate symporter